MGKILSGPVVDPSNVSYGAGAVPPDNWPDWFVADLTAMGVIVDAVEPARPAAAERAKPSPTRPRKRTAASRGR